MNRDVRITVTGTQDDGSGNQAVSRHEADGQLYERDGCQILLYREQDADSGTVTSNTLKLKGNVLELSRRGGISSRMIFEAGRTHAASHTTAYGTLGLDISTREVKCLWTESAGRIIIRYSLWMTGERLSENCLVIEINPLQP